MKKRIICILMAVLLLLATVPVSLAYTEEAMSAANALHAMGLFQGKGVDADGNPVYDLDSAPTRAEATTMFVRLLGQEDAAVTGTWTIPFTDVAEWAKSYVGYAYSHQLVNGTSETTFSGEDKITAAQYLTLILRSLGYESGKDFQWNAAWELTDQLGITKPGEYGAGTARFTRGDVAVLSYRTVLYRSQTGITADFPDEASLEAALNAGENVVGKTVRFTVTKLMPQSMFGCNLFSGQHLNFVSPENPGVSPGDVLTVRVTEVSQVFYSQCHFRRLLIVHWLFRPVNNFLFLN